MAWNRNSSAIVRRSQWMKKLDPDELVCNVSIPATRCSTSPVTQSMPLTIQFSAGIRCLDFRARIDGETIQTYHGATTGTLKESLMETQSFLSKYPSEFVLVRITTPFPRVEFDKIMETLLESIGEQYFWRSKNAFPTVGDCLGKIVILDNFSCDATSFGIHYCRGFWVIQDEGWITSIQYKLELIKRNFTLAKLKPFAYFANFLSGIGKDVTSEYVTCGPRLSILDRIRKRHFPGTNVFALKYINKNKHHVGIIFTDFPGPDLIKSIIKLNYE